MKDYFYILLVTSICTSLCTMMVSSGFEKYIKYIASLICVAVMVSPLRSIDASKIIKDAEKKLEHNQASDNLFYKTSGELAEENTKDYISQIIFNKFGIKPRRVDIEIDWGKEEPIIEGITVYLSGEDYANHSEIKDYLLTALGGEVEIREG